MNEPILFTTLNDADSITRTVIGSAGTISGTITYEASKFGNGVIRQAGGSYVSFPVAILDSLKQRGTFEMWIRPKVTQPVAFSYGVFGFVNAPYDTNGDILFFWGDGTTSSGWVALFGFGGFSLMANESTQFVATIGQDYHAALCWDKDGINGSSDTARIYRDGVLVNSMTTALPQGSPTSSDFKLCTEGDGAFDKYTTNNFKVYNYAKTDFGDRFDQRGGLNDQVIFS
jgi:hypothetical protein